MKCRYNQSWKCWKLTDPSDIECQNCLLGVVNTQLLIISKLLERIGKTFGYNIPQMIQEISNTIKKEKVEVNADYINTYITSPTLAILKLLKDICIKLKIPIK